MMLVSLCPTAAGNIFTFHFYIFDLNNSVSYHNPAWAKHGADGERGRLRGRPCPARITSGPPTEHSGFMFPVCGRREAAHRMQSVAEEESPPACEQTLTQRSGVLAERPRVDPGAPGGAPPAPSATIAAPHGLHLMQMFCSKTGSVSARGGRFTEDSGARLTFYETTEDRARRRVLVRSGAVRRDGPTPRCDPCDLRQAARGHLERSPRVSSEGKPRTRGRLRRISQSQMWRQVIPRLSPGTRLDSGSRVDESSHLSFLFVHNMFRPKPLSNLKT